MKPSLAVGLALVLVGACHSALPSEDAQKLDDALHSSAAAYRHASDGGAEGILIMTTYCSIAGVALDQKLEVYDGGVPCP